MSSLTARRRAYVAVQVTLTGGADHLIDLVNAVLAAESNMPTPPMVCPDACAHLVIQNDIANTGENIAIGDALISTTRYGYKLVPGEARVYNAANINAVQFGSLYALGDNDDLLDIEVMTY